jgi:hypothetical protein
LWVARKGCACDECEARLDAEGLDSAARIRVEVGDQRRNERIEAGLPLKPRPVSVKVSFRKARGGQWVVCGPTHEVQVGTCHAWNITTGQVREVYVYKLGRPFVEDGVEQRYGYIRR